MSKTLAMDVAILPPADVTRRAIELSAALDAGESEGLRLDGEHLPHVTLTQLYIREDELDTGCERIDEVLRDRRPLRLRVTGGDKGSHAVSMQIERTPELIDLHERLMEALRGFERADGGPSSFFGGDARVADTLWVAGYRLKSSFGHFMPHITIGHAEQPPSIEPFAFDAATVAACHLGRFCTCRKVLRAWTLSHPAVR